MTAQLEIRGRLLGGGRPPLICTPLVGRTAEAVQDELTRILPKSPDLLEWRVDFFDAIHDTDQVLATARTIRRRVGDTPVLFTRRSIREGGETIPLDEPAVVALYRAVCADASVDLIDFEMNNDPAYIEAVREASRQQGIHLILSYHNFQTTPSLDELAGRFEQAERLGADIGKVAVMPNGPGDVLTLLGATLQGLEQRAIPLISMSMGGYGSLSRLFGWVFGSSVSFAVGDRSSAPGQIPVSEVRTVIDIVRNAIAR